MDDTDRDPQYAVAMGIGAFALTLLFAGLALAIYPSWPSIGEWAKKADAPAWVQAIGSICAIFSAIAIASWQSFVERGRRRREEIAVKANAQKVRRIRVQMAVTASAHVRYVSESLKQRLKDQKTDEDLKVIQHNLQSLREYCERVPIWSLENSAIAGSWGGILHAVVDAESKLAYKSSEIEAALGGIVSLCRRFKKNYSNSLDELMVQGADHGWDLE